MVDILPQIAKPFCSQRQILECILLSLQYQGTPPEADACPHWRLAQLPVCRRNRHYQVNSQVDRINSDFYRSFGVEFIYEFHA